MGGFGAQVFGRLVHKPSTDTTTVQANNVADSANVFGATAVRAGQGKGLYTGVPVQPFSH